MWMLSRQDATCVRTAMTPASAGQGGGGGRGAEAAGGHRCRQQQDRGAAAEGAQGVEGAESERHVGAATKAGVLGTCIRPQCLIRTAMLLLKRDSLLFGWCHCWPQLLRRVWVHLLTITPCALLRCLAVVGGDGLHSGCSGEGGEGKGGVGG